MKPDNITTTPRHGLLLCEDTDNARQTFLKGLTTDGQLFDFAANIREGNKPGTTTPAANDEFAGATFSPDGKWLFVNIQTPGVTFAIRGPWARGSSSNRAPNKPDDPLSAGTARQREPGGPAYRSPASLPGLAPDACVAPGTPGAPARRALGRRPSSSASLVENATPRARTGGKGGTRGRPNITGRRIRQAQFVHLEGPTARNGVLVG